MSERKDERQRFLDNEKPLTYTLVRADGGGFSRRLAGSWGCWGLRLVVKDVMECSLA